MWIVKLDACGNKVWDKKFNLLEETYDFWDFVEVSDGYVLLGRKYLPNSGAGMGNSLSPFEIYVTKISKSGVKLWEKTYGNINAEHPNSIIPSGDGGFIISSTSNSPAGRDKSQGYFDTNSWFYSFPNYDLWILKIDGNGNKVWDKTIGNLDRDEAAPWICASGDGGYLISSSSGKEQANPNPIPTLARLTKIDALGNRIWTKTYLPTAGSYSTCTIMNTSDGNYIIGANNNNNYALIKVDPNGTVLWERIYGGSGADYLSSIKEFPNGDLLIGGISGSPADGDKSEPSYGGGDFWILRTDKSGNIIWNKTIRGAGGEWGGNLALLNDGSFVIGGSSNSPIGGDKSEASRGGTDIWILKVGTDQNTGAMTLGNINPTAYFPSAVVAVSFNASCTKPGETYTAQLSDQNGSFTNPASIPVNIGTFSGATSGTITGTIPADAIPGTGYKIRVVSSITNSITPDNGQYITIKPSQITTETISPLAYMPGAKFSVPYSILGAFKSGNVFTAQLSDANGYFVNSVNIGTLTSTTSGTISVTIPVNTPVGRGYRIRVVGSNPLINGSDNGVDISVGRLFTETINDKVYYAGDAITIPYTALGNFNSGNVFTAILSDPTGSFASNTAVLGTLTRATSGSINGIIPILSIPGAIYRVKVKSSNPAIDGTVNTKDIVIGSPIVTLNKINASGILAGSDFTVSYLINGRFNSNNQLIVQLSDAQGSFLRPINIGSVTSSSNGLINVQIPLATPEGAGYRIRIVSSAPSTVSNDNGVDIMISGILTNTVNPAEYYTGSSMSVSYLTNLQFASGNVFKVELSDGNGSFVNPRVIGSSSQTGPINATIPMDVPLGNSYRVRVVSTNPSVKGIPNPEDITIIPTSITVNLAQTVICPDVIGVPFTAKGNFNSNNVYTVLLSDAGGNFDNPSILGMGVFPTSGSWMIYVTIPRYTPAGSGYKIRVQSSSPYIESDVNITIKETPRSINSFSSTSINLGESVDIKSGNVLSFDGINDYVSIPGFSQPANGGALTVEFWLKVNAADLRNSAAAFSVGTDPNNKLQVQGPLTNGLLYFDYGGLSNPASRITLNYTPYLDKWTHVALVSSGKANTFKGIYLNGKLIVSESSSDGNLLALSNLRIGSLVNNSQFTKGMIDEFRIWNVMRTQEEIQAGMSRYIDQNTAGLMLYLQMHEGTGTVVKDRSGKGLDGNIVGAVWATPYTNVGYNWIPATTPTSGPNVTASSDYTANVLSIVTDYNTGCVGDYTTKVNVKEGIYTNSVGPNVRYTAEVMQVSFKTNKYFPQGTIFNVELSDANGSFASPRIIGSGSGQGNVISAKIPEDITPDKGYRVRVVSANPIVIGTVNPESIRIEKSGITLNLAENSNICAGSFNIPVTMTGAFNSNNVFSAELSNIDGKFTNPLVLNSLTWAQAGSMQMMAELPRETTLGTTYRLRVLSSSPYSVSQIGVSVNESPRAISLVSSTSICPGTQIQLKASKVLRFDGVDDYVWVPNYSLPANGGATTIEFWLKMESANAKDNYAFTVGTLSNGLIGNILQGSLTFQYGNSLNSASKISTDYNPYIGKWTHVALVSSGAAGTFKAIYLNGKLVTSSNTSNGNSLAISGLSIGSKIIGSIDEFRIWNVMRNEVQIKDGMNKQFPVTTPNLVLYLQMHEGTGTTVSDKSGYNLNGTLTNGPTWIAPYSNQSYSWTPATSPQTGEKVDASPTANTSYSLIVTNTKTGCQGLYYTPVEVKPSPCTQSLIVQYKDIDEPSSVSGFDYANSQGIEIFPNPNNGAFIITMHEAQPVSIEIVDAKGNKVKEVKGSESQFNIDAQGLSAGLYAVNILIGNKIVSRKVTIIK